MAQPDCSDRPVEGGAKKTEPAGETAGEPTRERGSPPASTAAGSPSQPPSASTAEARPRRQSALRTLAKFISANTNVVASFVIGAAGLLSTSIYQCNQGELSRKQAEAQMNIAREQAENSWRIERAKILSQNLQALTARGDGNVEQRYGVLLSLSRGSILEPDVAVSYALELGRDNPDYMSSVLANIERKDKVFYRRLLAAYELSCYKRFGVSSQLVSACKTDKMSSRSDALALFVADELEATLLSGRSDGPLLLLSDEREAEAGLNKLLSLFTPFLHEMYERRQWETIERFLSHPPSARLIGAFVLATGSHDAEGSMERAKVTAFRAQVDGLVDGYLSGNGCDGECRIRLLNYVLSNLHKGRTSFVPALRRLLARPRREIEPLVARINTRLLWCQFDPDDAPLLRDQILVPTLTEQLQKAPPDLALVDDLIGLLALLPEAGESKSWQAMMQLLTRVPGGRYPKLYTERRALALQQRKIADPAKPVPVVGPKPGPQAVAAVTPPPMEPQKSKSFCQIQVDDEEQEEEEE